MHMKSIISKHLEECIYAQEKIKPKNYTDEELKADSDTDTDNDNDTYTDTDNDE